MKRDPRHQMAEHYGFDNQAQQLIEEMAELTKAICKQFRIIGKGKPVRNMSAEEIEDNLIEELADVRLVLGQVIYLMDCVDEVENIEKQKITRAFEYDSDTCIRGFECERFGTVATITKTYDCMLDGSDKRAAEEAWKCFQKILEENPESHIKLTIHRGGSKIEFLI